MQLYQKVKENNYIHGKYVGTFPHITYQLDKSVGNTCVNTRGFPTKYRLYVSAYLHIPTLLIMSSYAFLVSYYMISFINVTIYVSIINVCVG